MMKIQNIPLFIIIFSFQFIYGQNQTNGASQPPGPTIEVPNLNNQFGNYEIPTTPDAYSLGTYGNLDVSNGVLNFQIPLYTIKTGAYTLPVYLSYSYTGLKVEEEAGIAGLGWSLHAGGLVQRELRGVFHDEDPSGGYVGAQTGLDYVIPFVNNTISANSIQAQVLALAAGQTTPDLFRRDTQPDKFNINMEGLSGSFAHNEYGTPVFYESKNYIIQDDMATTNNYLDNIQITDDKGVNYYFDDAVSTDVVIQGDIETYDLPYNSEWWISKIEQPNDSTRDIRFEYYSQIGGIVPFYQKDSYVEYKRIPTPNQGMNLCNDANTVCVSIANDISGNYNSYINQTVSHRKIIKTIYFDEGKIEFDVKSNNNLFDIRYYLNSVKIYRKLYGNVYFSIPFLTYEFEYDKPFSRYKLLKKVIKKDIHGNEEPFYHMDYNYENILDSLDNIGNFDMMMLVKNQDNWGYYNGKDNSSLLDGDRSPDFDKTVIGSLHKIYYPTDGHTEINYEANEIYDSIDSCGVFYDNNIYFHFNLKSYCYDYNWVEPLNTDNIIKLSDTIWPQTYADNNGNLLTDATLTTTIYRDTIHIDNEQTLGVNFTNRLNAAPGTRVTSKVSFSKPVIYTCNDQDSLSDQALFCLYSPPGYDYEYEQIQLDLGNAEVIEPTPVDGSPNEGDNNSNNNGGGSNSITLDTYFRSSSTLIKIPDSTDIFVEIKTQTNIYSSYAEGNIEIKSFSYPDINRKTGGIRVAATIDCPEDSSPNCIYTYYNYNNEWGQSTGKVTTTDNLVKENRIEIIEHIQNGNGNLEDCQCAYTTYSARSKIPLISPNGSNIYYEKVTKTINDGFQTGYEVYEYNTSFDNVYNGDIDNPAINDNIWQYGEMKSDRAYDNNMQLKSQNINEYEVPTIYTDNQTQQNKMRIVGLVAEQNRKEYIAGHETFTYPGYYEYDYYIFKPQQKRLKVKKSVQYHYVDSIVIQQRFEYDSLTGNLKKQIYKDSRFDDYHINYYYPNDVTNINSLKNIPLTQDEFQAYNLMKAPDVVHPDNLNMVSTLIQLEKVFEKTDEIISRQRITYHRFDTIPGMTDKPMVLPQKIWEEKGTENDLEVKKVISVYDDWGNPVETYQPDGTYTYNVWGYNHSKLIAQIINLKAADVNGVIADLIQTAIDASDDDAGSTGAIENYQNEKVLRQVLNDLQTSLPPETQMTYYTYDPLVGVTSITDPKGETRLFVYDSFNRLIRIMLDDGTIGAENVPQNDNTILKEFEYHYKE